MLSNLILKISYNFVCYLFQGGYGVPGGLGEDGEVKGFDFTEQTIRKAFIRKVRRLIIMCAASPDIAVPLSITFSFSSECRQSWRSTDENIQN